MISHRIVRQCYKLACWGTTGVGMGSQRRSCSTKLRKEPSAPHTITCPAISPSGPEVCTGAFRGVT